jgi:hypothetical protein
MTGEVGQGSFGLKTCICLTTEEEQNKPEYTDGELDLSVVIGAQQRAASQQKKDKCPKHFFFEGLKGTPFILLFFVTILYRITGKLIDSSY